MSQLRLRTGAWNGDRSVDLAFPDEWEVMVFWPRTPKSLSEGEIDAALEHPTDQAPIRELCAGKTRPVLVVDDLNRPTPVSVVMPKVLAQFKQAGVPLDKITIVIASGMHDPPRQDTFVKKLGSEALSSCRVITNDFKHGLTIVGKTRFGTPVSVNREVARSDFVMGIGGLYPNHTAGFGGGSKLALGVLGGNTIANLHAHRGVGWGSSPECDLRQELDEIARLVKMRTMITLHVNAERELVHMHSGDHFTYYKEAVAFSRAAYSVPPPEGADVVVSNTYPNDASLTFASMKGMAPLHAWAPPRASRVAIAACTDGIGLHNLFPLAKFPDPVWMRALARRVAVMSFEDIRKKFVRKITRSAPRGAAAGGIQRPPIWLYCTDKPVKPLPGSVSDMRVSGCWQSILESISREQEQKRRLKVFVYPCAPLQFLA